MVNAVKKVGILGGTFDPVHNGHLAMATEAMRRLDLNEVIFIPTGQPWQKAVSEVTAAVHRVKMLELAIESIPGLSLSRIEVDRPGPTYTADTLTELRKQYGKNTGLYFILGWDTLQGAPSWKDPVTIVRLCYLVAVPRPGVKPPDFVEMEKGVPGITARVVMLDGPEMDISATDIRRRVAGGLSYAHLVPAVVAEYIRQNRLYVKD